MHISKVFYIFALVNQLKLKGDYIMKVSIAVITSDADGCIEVTTKPFSTFEKATKYLMQQYKEIKDNEDFFTDVLNESIEVTKLNDDECVDFFLESEDSLYRCYGVIYTMEVE